MVTIYETCPDPSGGTYVTFRDYPFFGEFEFGDTPTATLAGYRSRILQFHSARSHAPGRPLPAMYGLRPYHRDQNYTEHWQFNASP